MFQQLKRGLSICLLPFILCSCTQVRTEPTLRSVSPDNWQTKTVKLVLSLQQPDGGYAFFPTDFDNNAQLLDTYYGISLSKTLGVQIDYATTINYLQKQEKKMLSSPEIDMLEFYYLVSSYEALGAKPQNPKQIATAVKSLQENNGVFFPSTTVRKEIPSLVDNKAKIGGNLYITCLAAHCLNFLGDTSCLTKTKSWYKEVLIKHPGELNNVLVGANVVNLGHELNLAPEHLPVWQQLVSSWQSDRDLILSNTADTVPVLKLHRLLELRNVVDLDKATLSKVIPSLSSYQNYDGGFSLVKGNTSDFQGTAYAVDIFKTGTSPLPQEDKLKLLLEKHRANWGGFLQINDYPSYAQSAYSAVVALRLLSSKPTNLSEIDTWTARELKACTQSKSYTLYKDIYYLLKVRSDLGLSIEPYKQFIAHNAQTENPEELVYFVKLRKLYGLNLSWQEKNDIGRIANQTLVAGLKSPTNWFSLYFGTELLAEADLQIKNKNQIMPLLKDATPHITNLYGLYLMANIFENLEEPIPGAVKNQVSKFKLRTGGYTEQLEQVNTSLTATQYGLELERIQ